MGFDTDGYRILVDGALTIKGDSNRVPAVVECKADKSDDVSPGMGCMIYLLKTNPSNAIRCTKWHHRDDTNGHVN